MPWQVTRKGEEYCVEKMMPDGKTENVTCHPTREKAVAHMHALYANEPGAKMMPKGPKAWEEAMALVVEAARR